MPSPLFEFFEVIAEELSSAPDRVILREDLRINDEESPILDNLKKELKAASSEEAIELAVEALRKHFTSKSSNLPFAYDHVTGRFKVTDSEFLAFVKNMSSIRSLGKRSQHFECSVAQRLTKRAKGSIHRVGHPREKRKTREKFNSYLRNLGFDRPVCLGKEKDGGFDIMWLLPLGGHPHKPIVSVQCKNGEFDLEVADASVGAGSRSFSQHAGLQPAVHVPCVLFNDYIYPKLLTSKQLNFVPLGLTDLAALATDVSVEMI